MVCLVKCPICKDQFKLSKRPKHYFQHCGMAIEIENNIVHDNTGKIQKKEENSTNLEVKNGESESESGSEAEEDLEIEG